VLKNKKTGKKKKGGGKTKMAAGACVAVALVLSGLGLDIGGFGSGLGLPTFSPENITGSNAEDVFVEIPTEEDVELTTTSDNENQEEAPLSLLIRVSGDSIIHNDQSLSIAELRELLTEVNQPEHIWELRDEHAIMATYNEVLMLLNEKGVRYEATTS